MKKGFTLIELLIVITIIGILAVVFLPSIMSAPEKARDAARIANVGNVIEAIEGARLAAIKAPTGDGCLSDLMTTTVPTTNITPYFGGGVVPTDPNADNLAITGCTKKGEYLYLGTSSTTATYKYAVVSRVEDPKNANVLCPVTDIDEPDELVIPATTGTPDCYAVRSQ